MDPVTMGLIAGGVNLLGGVVSNIFGASSAQKQQDFQAQEYATRYQTQMKDMQAAGLNPMLSYMQSPGSAPSGTSFTPSNVGSAAVSGFSEGASSARANSMVSPQINNMNADTVLKAASSKAALAQTEQALANARLANTNSALNAAELPVAALKAEAIAGKAGSDYALTHAKEAEAKNASDFYSSPIGKTAQRVGMFIKNVTGGGNSATALDAIPTIGRMLP